MTNQIEDNIVYLIVRNKEYGNEGVWLDSNRVLCSVCGREIGEHDLIIAGHSISICLECFASLNKSDLDQSACDQKVAT